jgi:hypothetical protein
MAGERSPTGLSAAGRGLWRRITEAYELAPAELAILEQAARTEDELAMLAEALAGEPAMVAGSMGQVKVNPLYAALREHRHTLDRLITSLALPMPGEQAGTPRSPAARRAARTRWSRSGRRGLRAVGED